LRVLELFLLITLSGILSSSEPFVSRTRWSNINPHSGCANSHSVVPPPFLVSNRVLLLLIDGYSVVSLRNFLIVGWIFQAFFFVREGFFPNPLVAFQRPVGNQRLSAPSRIYWDE